MYHYAQIDANGIVVGISFLSGEVLSDNMILLSESDAVDIGMGWIYKDGEWTKPEPEPTKPPIPQATSDEVIQVVEDLRVDLMIAGVI